LENYDDTNNSLCCNVRCQDVDEFDTTIPGPWMLKWEVINHNRHTVALPKDSAAKWGHLILG